MIKIVTTDLDGTLFDNKKIVSKYNRHMINKAKEMGVYVVIATGRPLKGILDLLEDLKLTSENDYAVCYNGAMVFNVGTKEIIFESTITGADVKRVYKEAQRLNLDCHAFKKDGTLITPRKNEFTDLESTLNKTPFFIEDFTKIDDNDLFIKAMIVGKKESIDFAMENVTPVLKQDYNMVRSAKIFLEFIAKGTDKGNALQVLSKHLNIDIKETMAIGDANNDKRMIEVANIGVAMSNSFKEILDIADYVTLSNEKSGFGHAVNRFIVKEKNE